MEQEHDLRESEMVRFGRWLWENRYWAYAAIIAAVAAVLIVRLVQVNAERAREQAWMDLASSQAPAALRSVAETHDIAAVQALAYLRAGDAQLQQVINPTAIEGEDPLDVSDPQQKLTEAADLYRKAYDAAPHPVYQANALIGMAAVAETQRDWEQAEQYWQQVQELAKRERLAVIADQAERRLAMLPDLQEPVHFGELAPTGDRADGRAGTAGEAGALPQFELEMPPQDQTGNADTPQNQPGGADEPQAPDAQPDSAEGGPAPPENTTPPAEQTEPSDEAAAPSDPSDAAETSDDEAQAEEPTPLLPRFELEPPQSGQESAGDAPRSDDSADADASDASSDDAPEN